MARAKKYLVYTRDVRVGQVGYDRCELGMVAKRYNKVSVCSIVEDKNGALSKTSGWDWIAFLIYCRANGYYVFDPITWEAL